ncbi:hypothetical protein [Streptomyces sp. ME19-01-6]|uniref:hypothetical protein n=1 Tax=Streptomyces sp. ME19-01-6 TaxID=3028686 RepID=UPI0029CA30BD|nr:hypothetical protein [Streptomyces sp. ME19-01-6]
MLVDRDDARVADDVAQRLQVIERRRRVEVGERGGMAAKPAGEGWWWDEAGMLMARLRSAGTVTCWNGDVLEL